jgi:hypothetical protein
MEPKRSIFQCAGQWGLPFGLYLSCAAVASIYADWFAPLQLVFLILLLGTPVVAYAFQRRKFIEDNGFTEYAGLWMLGIMLFILGTIISSLVVYLVLQYLRPNYIYEQTQMAIDTYKQLPQMRDSEILEILQKMVDRRLLPTPIETVFNAFWFITFGGCLVSAVTALVARRSLPKRR